MSDEFDKEAEREKLREKFADDDEKREHTQRMSELLLKGATMTNRHCDDCGDPIFRQDGREFCPTCHTVDAADVKGEGAAEMTAAKEAESTEPPQSNRQTGTPEPTRSTGTPEPNRPNSAEVNGSAASSSTGVDEAVGTRGAAGAAGAADALNPSESPTSATSTPASDQAAATPAGAVDDARGSLVRTLTRFARAAEATDDPRRARDHLQAAREAAETLAALDR